MTPDEQRLIRGLFERIDGLRAPEKDPEADAMIQNAMRARSSAPYLLVQTVLVQEEALERATARIRELEAIAQSQESPTAAGTFLGGVAAAAKGAPKPIAPTSVPSVPVHGDERAGREAEGSRFERPSRPMPADRGGGFLGSALTTAAGLAGGLLLADSLRGLFGHGTAGDAEAAERPETPQNANNGKESDGTTRNETASQEHERTTEEDGHAARDTARDEPQDADYTDEDWSDDGSMDI